MSDSSSGSVVLTREQLYEQVWQKPMLRLAREYGLSNVGLAKVCKKHNIPRPGRGYWAKLAHGKEVEKTPLPPLDDEGLEEIELFRQAFFDEPQNDVVKNEPLAVTAVVLDTLTDPDSLIEFARRHLEKRKPGNDGLLNAKDGRCLEIRVSPGQLDRALRIYDSFIKAWKSLGGEVRVAESKTDELPTLAAYGDTSVRIILYEETKRKQTNDRNRYLPRHMCDCVPTGKLVFEIDSYGDGLRRRWADGKTQRLEKLVESFTRGVHEFIEYRRVQRLDRECEQRQQVRVEEVRKARKQREASEKQRREQFVQFLKNWQ